MFSCFVYLDSGGQLLQEIICSTRSKFFPIKEDILLAKFHHPRKKTEFHKFCLPLEKGTTIHLKGSYPRNLSAF